ncbi:MAG: GntR family transcriptional regulator [Oscillospiraceae bacterium]|nr:GntR family transcriptional regulator [Oscillospiraceae bacterium]
MNNSIKDTVYQELRRRIIFCEIMPGSIIEEKTLTEEFKISRTPIREALNSLAQEGLVVVYPRRAITASPITVRDIDNLFEVRELLEPYIVRQVIHHIDNRVLVQMVNNMKDTDDAVTLATKDNEFHDYLSSACQNHVMVNMLLSVRSQTQRMRVAMGRQAERVEETRMEHQAITDAIQNGDPDVAETAMRKHLETAKLTVMGLYHPV